MCRTIDPNKTSGISWSHCKINKIKTNSKADKLIKDSDAPFLDSELLYESNTKIIRVRSSRNTWLILQNIQQHKHVISGCHLTFFFRVN